MENKELEKQIDETCGALYCCLKKTSGATNNGECPSDCPLSEEKFCSTALRSHAYVTLNKAFQYINKLESDLQKLKKEISLGFAEHIKGKLFDYGNVVTEEDIDEMTMEFINEQTNKE